MATGLQMGMGEQRPSPWVDVLNCLRSPSLGKGGELASTNDAKVLGNQEAAPGAVGWWGEAQGAALGGDPS